MLGMGMLGLPRRGLKLTIQFVRRSPGKQGATDRSHLRSLASVLGPLRAVALTDKSLGPSFLPVR
jgi:hypothetical protein